MPDSIDIGPGTQMLLRLWRGLNEPDHRAEVEENWKSFLAACDYHQVAPIVFHRLHGRGDVPPQVLEHLRARFYHVSAYNHRLAMHLVHLIAEFEQQRIPCLALKGPAVAMAAYGDLSLRQRGEEAQLMGPAGDPIVSTRATDPSLIKRIAAQAWLNRVLPAGDASLGLRAETDPGSRGNTYVQCESFVFEVRLQKSAYVMLLDLDSEGNLTVLYPTRASEREIIAGGAPRAIPGADPKQHILVTAPFGSDQVAVLAFERSPSFFTELTGVQRFAAVQDIQSWQGEVQAALHHLS